MKLIIQQGIEGGKDVSYNEKNSQKINSFGLSVYLTVSCATIRKSETT